MFEVSMDRFQCLLDVKLSGLFTLDEVERLHRAIASQLAIEGLAPGRFVQLIDSSDFAIQTQDVFDAFARLGADERIMPARLALVVGTSPSKMQARRSSVNCERGLFATRTEALRWLFAKDRSSRAQERRSAAVSAAAA